MGVQSGRSMRTGRARRSEIEQRTSFPDARDDLRSEPKNRREDTDGREVECEGSNLYEQEKKASA